MCGPIAAICLSKASVPRSTADTFCIWNMRRIRTETARFALAVNRDLLPLIIKNSDEPSIPSNPYSATDVLRRCRIESLVDFQMSVTTDGSTSLVEHCETITRQCQQGVLFNRLELLLHLLLPASLTGCGSVNPRVGNGPFPLQQMLILLGQALERVPLQSVVLRVLDAALDLPSKPSSFRSCRIRWTESPASSF